MMTGVLLVLRSRAAHRLLLLAAAFLVLGSVFGGNAVSISLSALSPPRKVPYPEVFGVVACSLSAVLLESRFWDWERIGAFRSRVVAGAVVPIALSVAVVPVLAAVSGLPGSVDVLPEGTAWGWLISNTLISGSLVLILSPFFGPLAAGGIAIVFHFAVALVDNLDFDDSVWLPLVAYPGPHGKWTMAVCSVAVTVAIHFCTHGSTTWARRLKHNE